MATKAQLEKSLEECRKKKAALATENANLKAEIADLKIRLAECEEDEEPVPPDTVIWQDDMAVDPIPSWKGIGAERKDGDPNKTSTSLSEVADGRVTYLGTHRRLRVFAGDDHWGERCELGNNSLTNAPVIYRNGERRVTTIPMRLGEGFPTETMSWQVVVQIKQVQPYAKEDTNGSPILAIEVNRGRWSLKSSGAQVFQGPPAIPGEWANLELDVFYSLENGVVKWTQNGTQVCALNMRTLKYATVADSRYNVGDPIPASLRIGPYHATGILGAGESCYVDYGRVVVR